MKVLRFIGSARPTIILVDITEMIIPGNLPFSFSIYVISWRIEKPSVNYSRHPHDIYNNTE